MEVLALDYHVLASIPEIGYSFCRFGILSSTPQHHLHNILLYFVLDISICCSFRPASDM
jgi:hypothetical protein